MTIKANNNLVLYDWMIQDLNLKYASLKVYALIYAFSQGRQGSYYGNLEYLRQWSGLNSQGRVRAILSELVDQGLLRRHVTPLLGTGKEVRLQAIVPADVQQKIDQRLIPSDSYIIPGWMVQQTDLQYTDLRVYALIYSYSMRNAGCFFGTANYMAAWCGCTRQHVYKSLHRLIEQGLVKKGSVTINGEQKPVYKALLPYDNNATGFVNNATGFVNNATQNVNNATQKEH